MGNIIIHWLYILQSVENIFTILSCWWENSFALWPCCWLWCWTFFLLSNCKRKRERLYGEAEPRFSGDKQRIKSCAMMELCRKWSAGPASAATLLLRLINPLCTSYVCYVLKLYIYTMLECYWNHRSLYILNTDPLYCILQPLYGIPYPDYILYPEHPSCCHSSIMVHHCLPGIRKVRTCEALPSVISSWLADNIQLSWNMKQRYWKDAQIARSNIHI